MNVNRLHTCYNDLRNFYFL